MSLPDVERLDRLSDAALGGLRASFDRHGFTDATISEIDRMAPGAPAAARPALILDQLGRRREPAMRVATLLTFGGALPRGEVDGIFGGGLVDALLDAALLVRDGDAAVRCPFRFAECGSVWILADDALGEPGSVMPPGPTTHVLATVMPDRCEGAVLDLGCGPGTLALVAAARGASDVVGVDVNPRGLVMAALNARFNGLSGTFLEGDVFVPVKGRRFPLIVAQPPFIARPEGIAEIAFLHGGTRGDAVLRRVLRGAAAALTPGGELLVLADVPLAAGEDVGRYLTAHLGGSGLDVMALHVPALTPEQCAIAYARHATPETGDRYVAEVKDYIAHFEREGVAGFRHVLFSARRAAPDAREIVFAPMPVRDLQPAGAAVRRRLWRSIAMARSGDAELLRERLRVAPAAEWLSVRDEPEGDQREHRVRFGSAWPAIEQIVTDEGLMLASLLQRSATVADAVAGYAALCDATPAEVRAPLLEFIRASLRNGMLAPEVDTNGR